MRLKLTVKNRKGDIMSTWTDERVEILEKLWKEGLSARQIAAELGGVKRNAVIGKIHRLGLSGRGKTHATNPLPRSKKERPTADPAEPIQPVEPAAVETRRDNILDEVQKAPRALELLLTELSEDTCKWPVGDPTTDDFYFCGHTPKEGRPYCPYHARLSYQPTEDRRKARVLT